MRRSPARLASPGLSREEPAKPHAHARAGSAGDPVVREVRALQSTAGNAAVASVVGDLRRGGTIPTGVQRQPKGAKAVPPWIKDAKASLGKMFPKDKAMANVVIRDYADLNKTLQGIDFAAWTNSGTVIYLRDPSGLADPANPNTANWPAMFTSAVLHHEAAHVRQFARDGGPPKTWQQMLIYERDAYGEDVAWLGGTEAQTLIPDKGLRDQVVEQSAANLKLVTRLLAGTEKLTGKAREKELHRLMVAETLIPASATMNPLDLYKQPK